MKQLLLAGLLLSLSFQIGCTKGRESTTQAAREPQRMSDSDLNKKIETQMNSDPQLRDANLSVSADADNNRVTLSGTVPSEALRTRAIEMARKAQPGITIDDKIDVKPTTKSQNTPTGEERQ